MKNRSLYATITVAKENQKKDIQIFETEDQKYGIEVVIGEEVKKVDNLTSNKEKIDKLLDTIILGTQNFTLLEDFAYDFKD